MNDSGDHEASSVPDEAWRQFAEDSEEAIRRSAPQEPSALERAAGFPGDDGKEDDCALAGESVEWVGQSYDASLGQKAWREMSEKERWRYLAQALLVAIVMSAVLLTVPRGTPAPDPANNPAADVVLKKGEESAGAEEASRAVNPAVEPGSQDGGGKCRRPVLAPGGSAGCVCIGVD
ncbi:hypothetical protein ID871_32475 [Streptomyces pratensis]|nr:hypothetical protein [Streptomyces pratensis]